MITASQVKELREMTGAGMMDCKKALTECDGDMTKAVDWLRERVSLRLLKKVIVSLLKVYHVLQSKVMLQLCLK